MADIPEPLAAFIVAEIRRGRASSGQTQEAFGRLANFSASHVSAVEKGTRALTMDFVIGADRALRTGGIYERMVVTFGTPSWLREWIEIERDARTLRWYEPAFIPGLLQTEAYARAALMLGRLSAAEVDQRVASRMERQAVLARDPAPQMFVVLDEMVIRRVCGSPKVMAEQLEHLTIVSELPNIDLRIVPTALGLYSGVAGGFIVAELPDGSRAGYVDNQLAAQVVTDAEDVASLGVSWDAVHGEALPRAQTLDLVKEVTKSWM